MTIIDDKAGKFYITGGRKTDFDSIHEYMVIQKAERDNMNEILKVDMIGTKSDEQTEDASIKYINSDKCKYIYDKHLPPIVKVKCLEKLSSFRKYVYTISKSSEDIFMPLLIELNNAMIFRCKY